MSNHLISIAYKRDLRTSMRKSVLVLMADKASDDGSGIWASKQTMADELCCSKQTVIETIKAFISEGLVTECGQRRNPNGYTVEYSIKVHKLEALPMVNCHAGKGSADLTGQPAGPVSEVDVTSQPAGPKPSLTILSSEAKASSPRVKFRAPPGVSDEQWKAFCAQRKKLFNDRSYLLICNKLLKISAETGWPPGDLIDLATERGWETVFAPRNFNNERSKPSPIDQLVAASFGGRSGAGEDAQTSGPGQHGRSGSTGLACIGGGRA